jgi:hypothetical protein
MKRYALAGACVLILSAAALAPHGRTSPSVAVESAVAFTQAQTPPDVPLEIKGDTAIVKVDRVVVIKEDRLVVKSLPFTVKAPEGGALYSWDVPNTFVVRKRASQLEVTSAPKGSVTISAEWVVLDWDGKTSPKLTSKFGTVNFDVGDVTPPAPPVPPVPPTPPAPPAPIPIPGLRVLIICEVNAGPESLNLIISGDKVRNYMKEKGAPKGFLALDDDYTEADLMRQEQWVRDAYKRPRTSIPWVIISNGVTGFEGPLPLTNAPTDALNLIKKFGG